MRHGSNSRRSRGRNTGGGSNNNNNNRRFNPKMHTYDSNGPEVRIRGNAYQIVEKYITLARDASSAGDNVLAESYYQFAEHYQRIINEFTSTVDRTESGSANNDENKNAQKDAPVEKSEKQAVSEKPEDVNASENVQAPAADKKPARKRTVREKKSETVDA